MAASAHLQRQLDRCPTKPLLLCITAALSGGLAGATVLAVVGGVRPVYAALLLWLSAAYTLCGVVAWWRRPTSRLGPLMILTGFCALATTLTWSSAAVAQTVGQALDLLPLVLIVHVFLAFPSGRARPWPDRVLVTVGYIAAVGGQLAVMMLGGPDDSSLLTIVDKPMAANLVHNTELVIISAVALAGVALLTVRRRADGRPLRRSLALLVDSFAVGLVMIAVLLVVGVFGGPVFSSVQQVSIGLLGLAPVAFLAGLLHARLARTAVGDLILELRADPANLRSSLSRALRDPSLRLAYWLPQFGSWADQDGRPVELPTDSRQVTAIERGSQHSAALIHDPALRDEPELLDAVCAAAAIALRTGRLEAELRASVEELRGSRERVIAAGQEERKRLERDLHDGAQQRLVALSLSLGVLQARLDPDSDANAQLVQARQEIGASLAELRTVARGLHPAVLSAHGLAVALESLAACAPVPVRLTVDVEGRVAEAVEVATYYVVSESLTNIGRHARAASATVDVTRVDDRMIVEVVDDGMGGADVERGTGLRGLADRVEALGGRLQVWTPRGSGTRVRAQLPCG